MSHDIFLKILEPSLELFRTSEPSQKQHRGLFVYLGPRAIQSSSPISVCWYQSESRSGFSDSCLSDVQIKQNVFRFSRISLQFLFYIISVITIPLLYPITVSLFTY
jgi:hypothetical protein